MFVKPSPSESALSIDVKFKLAFDNACPYTFKSKGVVGEVASPPAAVLWQRRQLSILELFIIE
jgi:hypothetical protein